MCRSRYLICFLFRRWTEAKFSKHFAREYAAGSGVARAVRLLILMLLMYMGSYGVIIRPLWNSSYYLLLLGETEMTKRIFSGAQPTGNVHLGNYLGALKNWVALQHEYESFFCIVNLHAITLPQDPKLLAEKTRDLARIYLAVESIRKSRLSLFSRTLKSTRNSPGC